MAQITVRFDNQLVQSDIIIPLTNSSYKESGESYVDNRQEIQQTSIYGIRAPLIMINHIVVDFMNVIDFKLDSIGRVPTVSMTVADNYGFIGTIDRPGMDNELRLQILPQFDNAYKKIDLTFFITSIRVSGKNVVLSGVYKSAGLNDVRFELLGQKNTFDAVSDVAKNIGLGFASNIEQNDYDRRYIYCNNISYQKLLDREVKRGGDSKQLLDWWIDYWNNVNLVDMFERYNAVDSDEDMMIWISGQTKEITEGVDVSPLQCVATLTNNPILSVTDLSASDYSVKNNLGLQLYRGTDKLYSVFEMNEDGYEDYLIQDGDVKKDVFLYCEYLGESFTDQNFLLKTKQTDAYLQKISTQTLEVTLKVPMLQLMRGSHCNFLWYINDSKYISKLEELEENGVISEGQNPAQTDASVTEQNDMNGMFLLDKSVSGQYMIIGNTIKYRDGRWETVLVLARPASINPRSIAE